jgi:YgiT-type zinc finger domain-containing protein
MYGHNCDYCDGIVQKRMMKRDAFKSRGGFVILENVPIGVCDTCGSRYYHASVLRRVAEIGANKTPPTRIEPVPVSIFV